MSAEADGSGTGDSHVSVTREVMRHSAIYGIANVIGRIASFLLLPIYARVFETTGYGILGMIDASVGLLSIAFGSTAQSAFLRIYHEAPEGKKPSVVGTSISLCWLLGFGLTALPVAFSPAVSSVLLGSRSYWNCICLALLAMVIAVAGESASTTLVIRHRSMAYSLINLLSLFVALGLNIVLVVWLRIGLIGVFIASLGAATVTSVSFHYLALQEHGFRWDRNIARRVCRFWFSLLPGEIIAYIARQAERVYVRFLLSIEALGVLEVAYKFAPTLNLFIMLPFMRAWRTKSLEVADTSEGPMVIGKMFTDFMLLMLFGGVLLATSLQELVQLMTPEDFWPAARIGQIEIATTIVGAAINYFLFGLLYAKRTGEISLIKGSVAIVKMGLSYWFVAKWGLSGAAYSALLMNLVTVIWIYVRAQRRYHIHIEWCRVGFAAASALAIVGLAELLTGGENATLSSGTQHFLIAPLVRQLMSVLPQRFTHTHIGTALLERQEVLGDLLVSLLICALFLPVAAVLRPQLLRGLMVGVGGTRNKA